MDTKKQLKNTLGLIGLKPLNILLKNQKYLMSQDS